MPTIGSNRSKQACMGMVIEGEEGHIYQVRQSHQSYSLFSLHPKPARPDQDTRLGAETLWRILSGLSQ